MKLFDGRKKTSNYFLQVDQDGYCLFTSVLSCFGLQKQDSMFTVNELVNFTAVEYILQSSETVVRMPEGDDNGKLGDCIRNLMEFRRIGTEADLAVMMTGLNLTAEILRFDPGYAGIVAHKVGVEKQTVDCVIFHSEDHFFPCRKFDIDTCWKIF